MRARAGVRGLLLAAALALTLLACGTPRGYVADPGPYDRVPADWAPVLEAARLDFDRGDARAAYLRVAPLALEGPRVLPVRVFLQEIELALLEREGRVGSLALEPPSARADTVLGGQYEASARARPSAEGLVLAARLAHDGEAALALLDEAEALDARCVWVHYGRAWWNHQMRRFKEARAALRKALRLDGGHPPSVRLQATLLAGAGDSAEAADALRIWLRRSRENPLFASTDRADAMLDLAALEVLLGEPGEALDLLEELDPRAMRDPVRAEEVEAAAHEARGDVTLALGAVERAIALDPDALLPLVQKALLLQSQGEGEAEREAWLRLLERTDRERPTEEAEGLSSLDFEAALFRLQAHTRLERLETVRP